MKVTWSLLRASEALLEEHGYQHCSLNTSDDFVPPVLELCHHRNSQIRPDVNVTAGYLGGAEENMSTVATRAFDLYGVLATMGSGAVKADISSLVAVRRIDRPLGLVPSAFEVVGDLGKGGRDKSKSKESDMAEHDCGWIATGSR